MKTWIALSFGLFAATQALAEERHFVCISDRDGSEIRLNRATAGDKGSIETPKITGDAVVFKGVGSMTFMHIEDQDVMTFVVHFEDMSYDLSVKGPHAEEDHGMCEEVQA
ncbi:hypothetical protein [uncultured Ruegeria sp.]|uniref:hypothetical protein n=1 Tax=uncultured Ruegeria sp. TaxID=259304 RepID=UPI0026137FF7|nr:hypothetical protein [uncultured Ruegeria sp.]